MSASSIGARSAGVGACAKASQMTGTLDGGILVRVPLFIKEGDVLKIDTRTGTYVERV